MLETDNGTGVRTAAGWVWLCVHCPLSVQLGMAEDLAGFDARRWADSVDATHYCWHKREGTA